MWYASPVGPSNPTGLVSPPGRGLSVAVGHSTGPGGSTAADPCPGTLGLLQTGPFISPGGLAVLDRPTTPQVLPAPPPSLDAPETESRQLPPHVTHRIDPPDSLSVDFRHSGWQRNRTRIFEAFYRTNQPDARLSQFAFCGAHAYVLQNVEDPSRYRIAGSACHDRFCLPCANERSRAIAASVLEIAANKQLRFLTLTVKSADEPLSEVLDKLYGAFQSFRRRKLWRTKVDGGCAFLEIKRSCQNTRWHPHLHILIEGRYFPYQKLKAAWYAITGDSFIIDIRLVRDSRQASYYVTKYAAKPLHKSYLDDPLRLDEAILALHGRKLVLTFGNWRGITLSVRPIDGAWVQIGTLESFIQRASSGSPGERQILATLTNKDLTTLYQRAPPLPPTGPQRPYPPTQITFFGVWNKDGTWRDPDDKVG